MNKITENNTSVGFKVKKNKNKFKVNVNYKKTDEKYYCKGCQYVGDCLARIKAHLICHSEGRPFVCQYDGCEQSFKRSNSLKRHVSAVHLNERLYSCNICQKKFTQSQSLNDHIFTHLEKKSFQCRLETCNKKFQTPKSLKAHQNRRHLQIISRMSPQKSHKFNENVEQMKTKAIKVLNSMIAQKTGLTPNTNINNVRPYQLFKCSVEGCGQSFQLQRSLKSHQKYSHSEYYQKGDKQNHDSNDDNSGSETETYVSRESSVEKEDSEDRDCDKNISQRQTISDNIIIDRISNNTYYFECNFNNCFFKTKSFEKITQHFDSHWQIMNPF